MEKNLFAIQSAVQGKLSPNSVADDSKDIALDFVNSWKIMQEETVMNARADGKNKIVLRGDKTCSFEVELEVLSEGAMLMLLGAYKNDDGKIILGETPTETYTYTGVAKMKFADGTNKLYDITIPNCVPQIGSDFGTSSLDLQTYKLTFQANTNDNGEFMTMVEHV